MTEKSTKFVYNRTLRTVEERHVREHVSGHGPNAVTRDKSIGWYATFVEEPSAVYLGTTETGLSAGDRVKLTLERVGPANVVRLPVNKEDAS